MLMTIEKVVIDTYIRSLPFTAKKLASKANPQSADQLVELVEGQQVALEVLCSGQPRKAEPSTRPKKRKRKEDHTGTPTKDEGTPTANSPRLRPFLNLDSRKCYGCGELGHIAWNCPAHIVPMPSSVNEVVTGHPCGLLRACWAEESGSSPVSPVGANGKDTTALLDSGSMVTLIRRPDFAQSPNLTDTVAITCIHGETKDLPHSSTYRPQRDNTWDQWELSQTCLCQSLSDGISRCSTNCGPVCPKMWGTEGTRREEEVGKVGGTPEGRMPSCVDSRKWTPRHQPIPSRRGTLKPDWRERWRV